jgi:glucose-1-phosphate adenylyltransferase
MKIFVLTQFKSHSLMQHLREGWNIPSGIAKQFIDPVPAQMRIGKKWYEGTADAIFQNMNLIEDQDPDQICIFGADHIYRMDIRQMMRFHRKRRALLTVAAIPVPVKQAQQFGIIEVDDEWRMTGFVEKPKKVPKTIPGNPGYVLASMGNYIFEREPLIEQLKKDSGNKKSVHDFGRNILPGMFSSGEVYVYDFSQNYIPGVEEKEKGYWKDVGTLDTYWETNMDLVGVDPHFNLYNRKWPVLTYNPPLPPSKFVHFSDNRTGHAINSMIGTGTIISGSHVENSVVGYSVRIHSYAHVEQSVIMSYVDIGRGAKIRKAIIDKHVNIAPGAQIGYDLKQDRKRFQVTESGIVVIPKGAEVV